MNKSQKQLDEETENFMQLVIHENEQYDAQQNKRK